MSGMVLSTLGRFLFVISNTFYYEYEAKCKNIRSVAKRDRLVWILNILILIYTYLLFIIYYLSILMISEY